MVKNVVCFALGGHIASQNASFKRLMFNLEPKKYKFFGGENGFKAFETGIVHKLTSGYIPKDFAGFVAGSGRAKLPDNKSKDYDEQVSKIVDFFRKGKFDIVVGSGGDDHGMQLARLEDILRENKSRVGRNVEVYVFNKTMDNDLGGKKPYTDFTNGFHTAVSVGVGAMKNHFSGSWTNNQAYLISPFGRDANWVGIAMSYWGNADRFIYGELPDGHPGHNINEIYEMMLEDMSKNEKKYGRRIGMYVISEGTRIKGIEHADKSLIDEHGHHKLNPEALVSSLKRELETKNNMKTQTVGITYEMRNSPPTYQDVSYAEASADIIADAILIGESGVESTFEIFEGEIYVNTAPIRKVSEKRFALYYPKPLINYSEFRVTDEIGKYYGPLFGEQENLRNWLPGKPKKINVFDIGK